PVADRLARRPERERLARHTDLALVRVVEPVEDVHQGRLARAVLAEEGVHLAGHEVEVDVIVGDDPGEALRDAAELEDGGLSQAEPKSMAEIGGTQGGRARRPAPPGLPTRTRPCSGS